MRKTPVFTHNRICQLDTCKKEYTPKTASAKYCSISCRKESEKPHRAQSQKAKRILKAKFPNSNKIQCLICNSYYTKPMAHVWQVHGVSAREYKEHYGLTLGKGIIPENHKQILRDHVYDNKNQVIDINLIQKGTNTRLKPNNQVARKYPKTN